MSNAYTISRTIEIDMGHRVPDHGSKCRNLHGHRYKIEAVLEAKKLAEEGEESGMVMDFGFIKELMMKHIHDVFDHALALYVGDPVLRQQIGEERQEDAIDYFSREFDIDTIGVPSSARYAAMFSDPLPVDTGHQPQHLALVVCNFTPTAERLAEAWYHSIADKVRYRTGGRATLAKIRVWETPNSVAEFAP